MSTNKQKDLIKRESLSQKVINFIKYHNAFVIGLMLVFVFTGAIFASENMRNTIIGEEIITQAGIDNSVLLAADLESFDLEMTIDAVFEDEVNYYIDYSFKTIGVIDNIWQEMTKANRMTINKSSLGDKDLALYISEELGEIVDYELAYLKQVQASEIEKGQTQIVQTTEYTGLIGLVLDVKNKVLPGYEPTEQLAKVENQMFGEFTPQEPEPELELEPEPEPEPEPVDEDSDSSEDEEISDESENPEPEPVCDTDHINLCNTQELCEGIGLFWYNDVCNLEAEPTPEPVCDTDHLDLCNTQELCEGIGLFWYNDACNLETEPELPVEDDPDLSEEDEIPLNGIEEPAPEAEEVIPEEEILNE